MAGNTEILIKRSLANTTPTTLKQGELAFSYVSNTIFIGSSDGTSVIPIGAYNNFSGIYAHGANTYGSQTEIPIITVAANGLITNVSTSTISTSLDIGADNDTSSVNLLNQTLQINGGEGITTTVNDQAITVDVDDTVVRSNTAIGLQTIDGNVQISGNLTVLGNQTIIDTTVMNVADPLIYLAANNYSSDIVDIGFVGNYYDGAFQRHAGLFRDSSNKEFYVFNNYDKEPTDNQIDTSDASFRVGTLNANVKSTVITLGGQDLSTFVGNAYAAANTADAKAVTAGSYANSAFAAANSAGTYANSAFLQANTPSYTANSAASYANSGFAVANSAASYANSGFAVANSAASYANSGFAVANSASSYANAAFAKANTDFTNVSTTSGYYGNTAAVIQLTLEANGRISQANTTSIAIAASQITSGTLGVSRGGTGAGTFTTNGVLLGQGTSAFTTASSSTEGHVLTINNSGVPTFSYIHGGTF